jgi:hypothetical protein
MARITFRASALPPRIGLSAVTVAAIAYGLARTSGLVP